ncbi:MAG: Gfo/Idh/MocA family protein, partial [Armatimonadota bacterium]
MIPIANRKTAEPGAIPAPLLRVGVVGCGGIGARHAAAVCSVPGARLVGCHDIDPLAARRVADRHGCAVFPDAGSLLGSGVDVVCVATPDDAHTEPVLGALAAGCHVFCEKPLATTLGEARKMRAAAHAAGRLLGVDYNRRFGFGYRKAREAIDDGRIGVVQAAALRVVDGIPAAYRPGEWSALRTLATHHIDLLRWFCGEIVGVSTRAGAIAADGRRHQIAMLFDHAGGAVSTLS